MAKGKKKKKHKNGATEGRKKASAQGFRGAAMVGAEKTKVAVRAAAMLSAAKTKDAVQFVYQHRQKILDALELIAAVVGTASAAIGKPDKRRKKTKRRKKSDG
jgi:hypothetical protein